MEEPRDQVTVLLARVRDGDEEARSRLAEVVHTELHRLAHRHMRAQPEGHTLQTTALLNEAWMRLAGQAKNEIEDRNHFLAVAGVAMRSVLVDHARKRRTDKRGGGHVRQPLGDALLGVDGDCELLLDLDAAVERLQVLDADLARVAELRCFGGLSSSDVARALGISKRTAERGWRAAQAWLRRELE